MDRDDDDVDEEDGCEEAGQARLQAVPAADAAPALLLPGDTQAGSGDGDGNDDSLSDGFVIVELLCEASILQKETAGTAVLEAPEPDAEPGLATTAVAQLGRGSVPSGAMVVDLRQLVGLARQRQRKRRPGARRQLQARDEVEGFVLV